VVFSFFKKDPKDARKGPGGRTRPPAGAGRASGATDLATRPLPKPIGRPLAGPTNRSLDRLSSPSTGSLAPDTNLPERERMRHNARRTAEKIDAIEAEMARDLMGNPSPTTVAPTTRPRISIVGETTVAPAPTTRPLEPAESVEINSEMLGGNIDAIEINTSGGSSVIDETAILFSNGQADAAENVLRAGLRRDDLGHSTRMAWHMLFELVNQRGDRDAFEKLTMDYALRFEDSPPAWIEYDDTVAPRTVTGVAPQPAAKGWPGVRLPESVDAGIVSHLEQLRALTAAHAEVQLDVSDARRIDIAGASLLLRVVNAFRRSHRELTLVGAAHFAGVLSQMVESGRRDPSDALWMLLLEVLRMLDRQDEFEEAAIQFCITFEVSPPSWERPPANLKVAPASSAPAAGAVAAATPMELRGTVDGEGEPHFSRLVAAAKNQPEVVIDCGRLRRLTFSAASALVGTLRKIRQGGSAVELRNVSALVTALLHLLGIGSIASVQSRHP